MVGIQINGEFLDLAPGVTMALEQQNPFLQFDNNIVGDYSLPVQALATEKNLRLLNYAAIAQQIVTNTGVDAILYDNSIQRAVGKVKIERASINMNQVRKGVINIYFLTTASGYWQDIKDKKLRSIDVGGDRSFDWDGLTTSGAGFWAHIHKVTAGEIITDYVFFPVLNGSWPEKDTYPQLMNWVYYDIGQAYPIQYTEGFFQALELKEGNRIVPFPFLKYVLTQAVIYTGWTIHGDILDDPDFEKIVMLNFHAIDWCKIIYSGGVLVKSPNDPVVFNLQDHLPDINISNFLIALKNRFGWWYDFDNAAKKITIRKLNDLATGTAIDLTDKSSPLITKSIAQEQPVYALRNNFATNMRDGEPDFRVIKYIGEVDKNTDLPAAVEALYGNVYLALDENNYYICLQNLDDGVWQWYPYAWNIFDYEPTGANEDITTDATTVGSERYSEYLDLIPRINCQGEWVGRTDNPEPASWGIHLVFYHGIRNNKSGDPYPFAAHHIYDSTGAKVGNWSLAFKGKTKVTHDEVGLYDLNWKNFLNMLSKPEEVEHTLYLPLHEYLQLKFSDRKVVNGMEFFIKQVRSNLPYRKEVTCTSIRV